jgi:Fur family ferric uptake transcriptional regulator
MIISTGNLGSSSNGTTPMEQSAASRVVPKPPIGCAMLLMDLFRSYLHQRRLPLTHQREVIAMTLFESERHLSVDDLADLLRQRGEHVGKATIYRTLNLLVEGDLARELDFGEGFKRYEHQAGEARHDHLICTNCGKVVRFARPELERLQAEIADQLGFSAQSRRLKIYGLCADCRAAGRSAAEASGEGEPELPIAAEVGAEGG